MSEFPVGQNWLKTHLGLDCPAPAVESWCGQTSRKTYVEEGRVIEKYPLVYAPEESTAGNLKFALKNETLDMGVMAQTMNKVDPAEIEAWVKTEPKGAFARRAWFLYEWFTGARLSLPDAGTVNYVHALDEKKNIGAAGRFSQRHKVVDNMLGVPGLCVTVRPTRLIADARASEINRQAQDIVNDCDPALLARAIQYLFTKETKSSFEIEREEPTAQRAERFVAALRNTAAFDPASKRDLVELQNTIVDPRYAANDFRDFQNFVGQTIGPGFEKVHFICPKPEDVEPLMAAWSLLTKRLRGMSDPVVAATVVAFAFVYIHPFEDGNGRIHRFLIHNVLSREGFTPPDFLFPVSAAIIRDEKAYGATLDTFSRPALERTDWRWDRDHNIIVRNDTAHLYRYFDGTPSVEFIYQKIAETVQKDLKEELDYIRYFDAGYTALTDVIDMPNRRAALFVKLCLQNGRISKKKRGLFGELTDDEVSYLEAAVAEAVQRVKDGLDCDAEDDDT
ncbi:Fic family protein [Ensifer sp. Root127]|uniref:Fic family protein n=1 Tax=Ensifer sp. Root127 TaxID=1736440 RepID=UPI0007C8EE57|nr:Fic family protein [Ensifer sp. Root127]